MKPYFADIRSRIAEEPTWFDDEGTPRYGWFRPEMLAIYDKVAVLCEIACQSCGTRFLVARGSPATGAYLSPKPIDVNGDPTPPGQPCISAGPEIYQVSIEALACDFTYGDPPRHPHPNDTQSCAGETMYAEDLRVAEAWERRDSGWTRRGDLEGAFPGVATEAAGIDG